MLKKHSSKELGTFEYDDEEYEIDISSSYKTSLRYIGNGLNIILPKGCISCYGMFDKYQREVLDLSNFDTSEVESMECMFFEVKLQTLDVAKLKTDNVKDMRCMFYGCKVSYLDLTNFNTENVTIMAGMFNNFESKAPLNFINFNTKNVIDMNNMFNSYGYSYLDLSNFNTENVKNTREMFLFCTCTELDLSSFNLEVVENKFDMFRRCNAVKHIGGDKLIGLTITKGTVVGDILKKYKLLGLEKPTIYKKMILKSEG